MENLAKNLKILIRKEKISEAELSRRCGVTQPMINRIVNAKTDNPKLKTLLRISRYFSISITELVEAHMEPENTQPSIENKEILPSQETVAA